MAKLVRMQYKVIIIKRPNDATDLSGGTPAGADVADTVLFTAGSYNNPPNAGETVFTSEMSATQKGYSVCKTLQSGLGQNARISVYGKPCGTASGAARRQLNGTGATTDETAERLYVLLDTISPGLADAVKYANQVPNTSDLIIRGEFVPDVPVLATGTGAGPADA